MRALALIKNIRKDLKEEHLGNANQESKDENSTFHFLSQNQEMLLETNLTGVIFIGPLPLAHSVT